MSPTVRRLPQETHQLLTQRSALMQEDYEEDEEGVAAAEDAAPAEAPGDGAATDADLEQLVSRTYCSRRTATCGLWESGLMQLMCQGKSVLRLLLHYSS